MQIPKSVIEKAVQGGWEPFKPVVVVGDGSWELIDFQIYSYAHPGEEFGTARINIYHIALDPTFWQALGKALGWYAGKSFWEKHDLSDLEDKDNLCPICNAHRFYNLVLQGKADNDISRFWENLLE